MPSPTRHEPLLLPFVVPPTAQAPKPKTLNSEAERESKPPLLGISVFSFEGREGTQLRSCADSEGQEN